VGSHQGLGWFSFPTVLRWLKINSCAFHYGQNNPNMYFFAVEFSRVIYFLCKQTNKIDLQCKTCWLLTPLWNVYRCETTNVEHSKLICSRTYYGQLSQNMFLHLINKLRFLPICQPLHACRDYKPHT
jgi:hypothetical protein